MSPAFINIMEEDSGEFYCLLILTRSKGNAQANFLDLAMRK